MNLEPYVDRFDGIENLAGLPGAGSNCRPMVFQSLVHLRQGPPGTASVDVAGGFERKAGFRQVPRDWSVDKTVDRDQPAHRQSGIM